MRMAIWTLDGDVRRILKYLIEKVKEKEITQKTITEILFKNIDTKNYNVDECLNQLINNNETIFDQHGDPEYSLNGLVVLISPEKFFSLAINNIKESKYLNVFLSTYPLFMSGEELYKLIKQEDRRYKIYVEEKCKGNIDLIDPIEKQKHFK